MGFVMSLKGIFPFDSVICYCLDRELKELGDLAKGAERSVLSDFEKYVALDIEEMDIDDTEYHMLERLIQTGRRSWLVGYCSIIESVVYGLERTERWRGGSYRSRNNNRFSFVMAVESLYENQDIDEKFCRFLKCAWVLRNRVVHDNGYADALREDTDRARRERDIVLKAKPDLGVYIQKVQAYGENGYVVMLGANSLQELVDGARKQLVPLLKSFSAEYGFVAFDWPEE